MTNLLSVATFVLGIITVISVFLSLLLHSQNPKILHSLSYTQLRTKKIQYDKQKPNELIVYDSLSFLLGWLLAFVATVILSPVLLAHALLLILTRTKPIIVQRTIIGKNQKPVHLYRFNTPSTKNAIPALFIRILISLDKASATELPILFNILLGHIALFGLTQIRYDDISSISLYNNALILQQYDQHRPGLVSLSALNRDVLRACKTSEERYEIISFLNSVFLQRRSLPMLLNVLKTTMLLGFRPIP